MICFFGKILICVQTYLQTLCQHLRHLSLEKQLRSQRLKEIVHPNIKMLSSFGHPQVFFVLFFYEKRYVVMICWWIWVSKKSQGPIDFHCIGKYYGSQWVTQSNQTVSDEKNMTEFSFLGELSLSAKCYLLSHLWYRSNYSYINMYIYIQYVILTRFQQYIKKISLVSQMFRNVLYLFTLDNFRVEFTKLLLWNKETS